MIANIAIFVAIWFLLNLAMFMLMAWSGPNLGLRIRNELNKERARAMCAFQYQHENVDGSISLRLIVA